MISAGTARALQVGMTMTLEFHGVRGSLPSPGAKTALVGGNTSCVELRAEGTRLLLDAGTGLRPAGDRLLSEMPVDVTLLLSHVHWDHIQGLPFFTPLYVPGNRVAILSGPNGSMPLEEVLRRQFSAPFHPVAYEDVAPQLRVRDLAPDQTFSVGPMTVRVARLNHPDPVYGYRIEHGGRAIVYATDTEHFSCVDPHLRRLAEGADVLIYDAQYTPEEYRGDVGRAKVGWGHSTYEAAAQLAHAAGVGQLVLFHHDPQRSDAGVGEIERRSRELFPRTIAAREGLVMSLAGLVASDAMVAGPGQAA
jgi:phosphoribosyl 1,2-cyclic phosphodiesterase